MAIEPLSARASAWKNQFNNYLSLTQQLERAAPHQRESVERALAEAQDDLLDMPAPTFSAVLQKLEMLWETEMHGLDQASEERRLILEDLSGLIQAQSALLGS